MSNIMNSEMKILVLCCVCLAVQVKGFPGDNGLQLNPITNLGLNLGAANGQTSVQKQNSETYETYTEESSSSDNFQNGLSVDSGLANLQLQLGKAQGGAQGFGDNGLNYFSDNFGGGSSDLQKQISETQSSIQKSDYNNILNTDLGTGGSQLQNQFNKAQGLGFDSSGKNLGVEKSEFQKQFSNTQSSFQNSDIFNTGLGGGDSQFNPEFNKNQNFGSNGLDSLSNNFGISDSNLQNQLSKLQNSDYGSLKDSFGKNVGTTNSNNFGIGDSNLQNHLSKLQNSDYGSLKDSFGKNVGTTNSNNFGIGDSNLQNQLSKLENSDYGSLKDSFGKNVGKTNSNNFGISEFSETYDYSKNSGYDSNQGNGLSDQILYGQPQIQFGKQFGNDLYQNQQKGISSGIQKDYLSQGTKYIDTIKGCGTGGQGLNYFPNIPQKPTGIIPGYSVIVENNGSSNESSSEESKSGEKKDKHNKKPKKHHKNSKKGRKHRCGKKSKHIGKKSKCDKCKSKCQCGKK